MAGDGAEEELTLSGTPTWIVAVVCTVIIFISLFFDRLLHHLGKIFLRKNQKPLFQALLQMKGELMVMGFISLLLVISQGAIQKICIPVSYTRHLRPCQGKDLVEKGQEGGYAAAPRGQRLLSEGGSDHCQRQGKVPFLSIEAIHELHIFIFALAITHVILSLKTIALAGAKIHKWKFWEDSIHDETLEDASISPIIAHAHGTKSICDHYGGIGRCSVVQTWVHAFFKQFFSSVTNSEYRAMRLGFIMTHCNGNLKFDFYSYMVRALEEDYKKVIVMSWYLWVYVILFLLFNIAGWHEYFWLSFVPLIIAFGYSSCGMDKTKYVIPRLVISFGVRVMASYVILPLYAIVTQMGSTFKPVIFKEHVKDGLIQWAQNARKKNKRQKSSASRRNAEEDQIQSSSSQGVSVVEDGGDEIVEEHEPESNHRPTLPLVHNAQA